MSDSLEKLRLLSRAEGETPSPRVTPVVPAADDEEAEAPCFGFLRGVRERAVNIEFRRLAKGDEVSFPYTWLGPTRHHPSVGILLLFSGPELYLVTLKGRNLNAVVSGVSLYDRGLLRHRVTWVREATHEESKTFPETACVVEHIEIASVSEEEAVRLFHLSETSA